MKDEEIITRLAKQYDFIYSPNVAASENFDEDKYANTTDVTVWKDLVEDGKIQLSTGSLVRNITLNFCQPFAIQLHRFNFIFEYSIFIKISIILRYGCNTQCRKKSHQDQQLKTHQFHRYKFCRLFYTSRIIVIL